MNTAENMVSSPHGPIPGCPNNPPCGHAGLHHDVWDENDPLPMCCVYNDNGDCPCGRPPAGYRRVPDQRVWRKGDLVPAGVHVLTIGGATIDDHGADWVNTDWAWLTELEKTAARPACTGALDCPADEQQHAEDCAQLIELERD